MTLRQSINYLTNRVEELEAENALLTEETLKVACRYDELYSENTILRAALSRLVDASEIDNLEEEHGLDQLTFARDFARQALEPKETA